MGHWSMHVMKKSAALLFIPKAWLKHYTPRKNNMVSVVSDAIMRLHAPKEKPAPFQ
jgi:hypothetical protein